MRLGQGRLHSGDRCCAGGVHPYLDNLGVVDRKHLVQAFGRCRPGPLGLMGHGHAEHDGITVDLHALEGGPDAFGPKALGTN